MLNLKEAGFYEMTETQQLAYLENYERNKPAPGKLVEKVVTCAETGRKSREWIGDKSIWMDAYKAPARLQIRINKDARPSPYYMLSGGKSA